VNDAKKLQKLADQITRILDTERERLSTPRNRLGPQVRTRTQRRKSVA
jgi:hypothetical protein